MTHSTEDRPYGATYTTGRASTSNRAEGGLFMFQKLPPALACFRVILVGVSHVGPREQQVSIATTQRLHRQSALNEAFCCAAPLPFLYRCHLRTIIFSTTEHTNTNTKLFASPLFIHVAAVSATPTLPELKAFPPNPDKTTLLHPASLAKRVHRSGIRHGAGMPLRLGTRRSNTKQP